MIDFLEAHYKLLSGIIVAIIVAIIGILKVKSLIKKSYKISGDNNNLLTTEKNMNNTQSFNTVSQNNAAIQVAGNNNQISNFDMNTIQILCSIF